MNIKQKLVYDRPISEIFEVKLEANVLQGGSPGAPGSDLPKGNSWTFGDDEDN